MATPSVQVRALVDEHRPTSRREAEAKARFLAELDHLVDPYDEHADLTHVTASAIVVGRRGTVLHLHKRLARWMQPGGHIDPGEEPPDAARREAVEELGLEVAHPRGGARLIHLDVHEAALGHTHLHKRLARWMQPGGHIDPGEEPPDAALREAVEELGLDVAHPPGGPRLIHLDVHEAALGHTHLDLRYVLFGSADDPHPPPGESPEARWFAWGEASAMADEALAPALLIARAEWDAADE